MCDKKSDLNNWPSYPAGVLAAQIAGVSTRSRLISGAKRAGYRGESFYNTLAVTANQTPTSGQLGGMTGNADQQRFLGSPQLVVIEPTK